MITNVSINIKIDLRTAEFVKNFRQCALTNGFLFGVNIIETVHDWSKENIFKIFVYPYHGSFTPTHQVKIVKASLHGCSQVQN